VAHVFAIGLRFFAQARGIGRQAGKVFFLVSEGALTMLANAVPFVNPNPVLARSGAVLALAVSATVAGACAGSTDVRSGTGGAGGSSSGSPDAGPNGVSVPLSCDNAMLVLEDNCTGCHTTLSAPYVGDLDLSSAGVAQRLVGKPTAAVSATNNALCSGKGNLLNRGTLPATGIFIDKINQIPGVCGNPMPFDAPKLAQPDLDCLQSWANGLVNSVGP
jgi:hypothetical protein